MINDFKTNEDLQLVIKLNKPEKVIRTFYLKNKQYNVYQKFIDTLEDLYTDTYPDTKEYTLYDKVEVIETDIPDETKTIYYYQDEEVIDDNLKPTFELFKQEQIDKWVADTLPTIQLNNSYTTFIKPILLNKINNKYEEVLHKITKKYPQSEKMTWFQQYTEAVKYKEDNSNPTPMIDAIATNRGVDKDIIIDKIITKAKEYNTLIGTITGLRQQPEDFIDNIENTSDIDTFNTNFNLYSQKIEGMLQ